MTDASNRPQFLWAVTSPDWRHGKPCGRRADWATLSYLRRDAIEKFKSYYPEDRREEVWRFYRTKRDHRVERVTLIVGVHQ